MIAALQASTAVTTSEDRLPSMHVYYINVLNVRGVRHNLSCNLQLVSEANVLDLVPSRPSWRVRI